jgi:mRNA-degrading endonuclease RelE of RelBE toxin-antitoxin system
LKKSSEKSTAYRVGLADSAKADADAIYKPIIAAAILRGAEWFEELMDYLYTLETLPYRCPLAREAKKAKREIRCLLFGKGRNIYRILCEVDEAKRAVWIVHIRHGARRDLKAREIADPTQSSRG